jgi:hypothetical protein
MANAFVVPEHLVGWSVIHGTHNPFALAGRFVEFLEEIEYPGADTLRDIHNTITQTDDEEELGDFLYDELYPALEEIAPEGYYFGSHDGDGSDFGYWAVDEVF